MTILPIDEVDEPLRGFKFAEVRGTYTPRIHPSGRYRRHAYEHRESATAVCHRRTTGHIAPHVDCTCGFYAVTDPHALPEVTEHYPDMVLLEVELAGTVIEHEAGLRGEQQIVLGAFFPGECHRCRRPATHVQPGDTWRSVCTGCGDGGLNPADATALLGVDVGFSRVPSAGMPKRAMHTARTFLMCVLMTVFAIVGQRAHAGVAMALAMVAGVVATFVFAAFGLTTRQPRRRETWFQAQCLALTLASLLVVLANQ